MSRFGYRPQLPDQPKTDEVHNLYEQVEGYDQAQGSFDKEARAISLVTGLEMHPGLRRGLMAVLAAMGYLLLARRK